MPLSTQIKHLLAEKSLIGASIAAAASISELQFYASELAHWENSEARAEMLSGDLYYTGGQAISARQRTTIGPNGSLQVVPTLPNNKITDNQYAKHVDQKVNYLVGQPVAYECDDPNYASALKSVLGSRFMRTLRTAVTESLNSGIAWLYPYYSKNNELIFEVFPGYEVLPFWADSGHTVLDVALRLYSVEMYLGPEKKTVQKVDVFKDTGMTTYLYEHGHLTPEGENIPRSYLTVNEEPMNWERLPLIPIKYNAREIPLIRRGKALQDALNLLTSDLVNVMQEDVGSAVLVLKNYDGQDLGEFRQNLSTYRAIKTRTFEGKDGGVDSLEIEVNAENYKTVLELLKKALIENLRSYDAKDDRLSGSSPNQMNIQSMYCDIDLDANAMETELQASFEELLWFVEQHLANTGQVGRGLLDVVVTFNRDILINETEAIENCSKSVGIISDESIIAQHPWVDDPVKEVERMEKQKEEAESDPYRDAFVTGHTAGGDTSYEE